MIVKSAKGIILAVLGVFILSLLTIAYFQIRSYKTAMILAQIEKGKIAVNQKKAVDALNAKHKVEIAGQEAEILKQKNINVAAEAVISSIKVSSKAEIVALRASGVTWDVKFTTLEADYDLLLDVSGKKSGLIEGLKLEIGGLEEEVFILKRQYTDLGILSATQREAWKKTLANTIRKASRSFGIVVGPSTIMGIDAKMHYGVGIMIGFRIW